MTLPTNKRAVVHIAEKIKAMSKVVIIKAIETNKR